MGRRVRILHEGEPVWGGVEGEEVVLEDRGRVPEAEYLAPVEPTKILAVHLTYRSRVDEYAARTPPQPSYFVNSPGTLNGLLACSGGRGEPSSSTTRASLRS
jgi:5-oxopent-3-ene-1,2,5-tricarboxylate decarboxylase/2-hydroxyhepta-2,4-diene-1,7-dioate isomerase